MPWSTARKLSSSGRLRMRLRAISAWLRRALALITWLRSVATWLSQRNTSAGLAVPMLWRTRDRSRVGAGERQVLLAHALARSGAEYVEKSYGGLGDHIEPQLLALVLERLLAVFLSRDLGAQRVRPDQLGQTEVAGQRALALGAEARLGAIGIDLHTGEGRVELWQQVRPYAANLLFARRYGSVEGHQVEVDVERLLHRLRQRDLACQIEALPRTAR